MTLAMGGSNGEVHVKTLTLTPDTASSDSTNLLNPLLHYCFTPRECTPNNPVSVHRVHQGKGLGKTFLGSNEYSGAHTNAGTQPEPTPLQDHNQSPYPCRTKATAHTPVGSQSEPTPLQEHSQNPHPCRTTARTHTSAPS